MTTSPIQGPFLSRKASASLREQLMTYLRNDEVAIGSPFFSDAHLMKLSGLSRKTVRRAMDELQRDGWIERRPGRGSYVGPRAKAPLSVARPTSASSLGTRSLVRLAVIVYGMNHDTPDWYSQGVLAGLDEVAVDSAVSIELMGDFTSDIRTFSRRLEQSRPDVLAVLPSTTRNAFAIGEAQRVGIPCLLTGTRFLDLGLPTVCEDGRLGAAAAVARLAEQGHRRIGIAHRPDSAPWVFQRREGFMQGLAAAGIEPDERMICWMPGACDEQTWADQLQQYVERQRPTALVLSSGMLCRPLGEVMRRTGLQIPRDLSVVGFDQTYTEQIMHLGRRLTTVELPLREMGRRLGRMARQVMENREPALVDRLPCDIVDHASIAPAIS